MQSAVSQPPPIATPSPNKRSTFRSKTKLKEMGSTMQSKLKTIPSFYVYIKDFPLQTPQDVVNIIKSLEPTNTTFLQHLQNLKLYKPNLSSLLQDSWAESMQVLKAVVIKLSKRGDKHAQQKQKQIAQLLRINRQLQKEQLKWKQRIQNLQHLRELQNAQLNMVDAELQLVSGEMTDIYKLLQGDMKKVGNYLTKLQERKSQQNDEGSNEIYDSLKTMSLLLGNMQNEQRTANSSLQNMRQLIKAMTKSTKISTSTQVDESQLQTQAGAIFNNTEQQLFHIADASSINVNNVQHPHLIDQLKAKEQMHSHELIKQDKHADKPWALTPTLMAFLQNMSKQNQAGKVLPWEYTKQIINQIYNQRISYETDLMSGGIGNGMLFDQFVVFFFIQKHRIRRLAQVKLLEFIISLRYYVKFWPKAETFCQLMDVMRYQPLFQQPEGFNYKLDYNVQHFFFVLFKKLSTFHIIEEEGQTFVQKSSAKKLLKVSLFFSEDYQKSRLLAKLDKDLKVIDKTEYCDFDWALSIMVDQYFSTKKRVCTLLNKLFSKKFEENQGYFSVDDLKDLFNELSTIFRAGSQTQYRYPLKSDLQLGKLYLYACTSGRNTYDVSATNFIAACQRYGFDAPFPFLHLCSKKTTQQSKQLDQYQQLSISNQGKSKQKIIVNEKPQINFYQDVKPKADGQESLNRQRIDIGASIFSQHFGILRQLRMYVDIFTKTLKEEKKVQTVWKSFEQIGVVLQKGCQFMKYPLLDKKK